MVAIRMVNRIPNEEFALETRGLSAGLASGINRSSATLTCAHSGAAGASPYICVGDLLGGDSSGKAGILTVFTLDGTVTSAIAGRIISDAYVVHCGIQLFYAVCF